MLLNYYNLQEQPFGATPDPRYLYMSPTHREALASLCYGIQSARGFMSIIAKPGMGKTTILFELLNQLQNSARTVFLFQTLCRPEDLLRGVLRDLGVVDDSGDILRLQSQLDEILLAEAQQGRKVVVVIDEAQNLQDSALELVRMLSNFETPSEKLLQIVLAGQPQLSDRLASPHLLQLRQRMSMFARLHPFNLEETHLYIEHRLRVAGNNFRAPLFTPQAEKLIAKYSEGIPRNINNICFHALSLGYVLKQRTIEKSAVREVLNDLDLDSSAGRGSAEVENRMWTGWSAVQPKKVFAQAFAWRNRVALFAVVLVPLLWMSGRGRIPQPVAPVSFPAGVNISAASTPVDSLRQKDSQIATVANMKGQTAPESASGPSLTRKSNTRSRKDPAQKTDPATLWKQVRSGRSDAEVELARTFLQGTGVEQNCQQAQILLQDASRKGNARASDLLKDPVNQCR